MFPFPKGDVFVCGDFNARSGTTSDLICPSKTIAGNYLSQSLPPELNLETSDISNCIANIPPRNNQDDVINTDGRELLDFSCSHNLHILNGRTIGDLFGSKTLHNVRGSSCIDYILAPTQLRRHISSFKVLDFTEFSDHCPLSLSLTCI